MNGPRTLGWPIRFVIGAAAFAVTAVAVGATLRAPEEAVLYCILHWTVCAFGLAIFSERVASRKIVLLVNPAGLATLIHLLYYTLSGVKYFTDRPFYYMFDLTRDERLLGSLVGGAVLLGMVWISTGPWNNPKRASVERLLEWRVPLLCVAAVLGLSALLWLRLMSLGYVSLRGGGGEYSFTNPRSYEDLILLSSLFYTCVTTSVIAAVAGVQNWFGPEGRKPWPTLFAAAAILIELYFIATMIQSRLALATALLLPALALQLKFPRRTVDVLNFGFVALPAVTFATMGLVLALLGRQGQFLQSLNLSPAEINVREMEYRSDLTDFGVAVILQRGRTTTDIVREAAINAVPRAFWPSKPELVKTDYDDLVASMGWYRMDFPDTLFSSGVVAFGRYGFVFWPLAWIALLVVAGRLIWTIPKVAAVFFALVVSQFATFIELGWFEMFNHLRSFVFFGVATIVMLVIVYAIVRVPSSSGRPVAQPT